MSNFQSTESQAAINSADQTLDSAISQIRSQNKSSDDISVEVIPENSPDVDIEIDAAPAKEPRRSEFVKTDDPKVLERINDLYGQVKKSDSRNQMIIEHNKQLEMRLAEYAEKMNRMERGTQDAATNKVESELKSALKSAREDGDFERIDQIENQILDLKMERRLSGLAEKFQAPPEIPKQKSPEQQHFDTQFVHNAHYIENLATEKDPQGNLVRPYLYDWHPKNKEAVDLFQKIPQEFAAAGKQVDMETLMTVMDERLRGKKPVGRQSVLGGDTNEAPARTTVRLTQAQINVARNMGISPERYAKQLQLMNS